jgi:uncharacterized protein (TIGR02246 family)
MSVPTLLRERPNARPVVSLAPSRTPLGFLLLPAALGVLLAACDTSPVEGPTPVDAVVVAPDGPAGRLAVVPPAMARDIHDMLGSWSAAWNAGDGVAYGGHYAEDADFVNPLGAVVSGRAAITATHVFLFNPVNGPFRGSTASYLVRRITPLTGSLALVDTTVSLIGFAGTPPGLVQWEPGVVKTRHHMVVGFQGNRWEILSQQTTAMQPGTPD